MVDLRKEEDKILKLVNAIINKMNINSYKFRVKYDDKVKEISFNELQKKIRSGFEGMLNPALSEALLEWCLYYGAVFPSLKEKLKLDLQDLFKIVESKNEIIVETQKQLEKSQEKLVKLNKKVSSLESKSDEAVLKVKLESTERQLEDYKNLLNVFVKNNKKEIKKVIENKNLSVDEKEKVSDSLQNPEIKKQFEDKNSRKERRRRY